MKRVFAVLLTVCLILMLSIPVFAADYTYTVRIYAGDKGSFGGKDYITLTKSYNGRVDANDFNPGMITLKDSKYYVIGIRESGKDNSTVTASFPVIQDQDFVVAYGILGDSVAYTVNYVDTAGRTLHASDTYYGNVGDRPVVSYRYIENYQPQYYNITGTLKSNAAENNWTFVYNAVSAQPAPAASATPTPAATGTGTGTGTGTETGTGTGTETPAENQNPAGTATPPEAGTEPGTEGGTEPAPFTPGAQTQNPGPVSQAPAQPEQGGNIETPSEPEEILDIDAPRAEYEASGEEGGSSASAVESSIETPGGIGEAGSKIVTVAVVGGCIAGVAIIAIIVGVVASKKKNRG